MLPDIPPPAPGLVNKVPVAMIAWPSKFPLISSSGREKGPVIEFTLVSHWRHTLEIAHIQILHNTFVTPPHHDDFLSSNSEIFRLLRCQCELYYRCCFSSTFFIFIFDAKWCGASLVVKRRDSCHIQWCKAQEWYWLIDWSVIAQRVRDTLTAWWLTQMRERKRERDELAGKRTGCCNKSKLKSRPIRTWMGWDRDRWFVGDVRREKSEKKGSSFLSRSVNHKFVKSSNATDEGTCGERVQNLPPPAAP